MKRLVLFAVVVCLFVINVAPLSAQFETASVLGYVRDSSGSVLAGATVSLINEGTKTQVTAQTDAQGSYQFTDVKIGEYRVSVQAPGFGTSDTAPFTVTVNARQRVDVTLKIGSSTEVVTVDLCCGIAGNGFQRARPGDRHSRGRKSAAQRPRLCRPRCIWFPAFAAISFENTTDSSRDASFNVNGQRSEFNNFLLDGLDNNAYGTSNQGFSNQAIPPSPDAIYEFRVETDNYSAEYGRSAGAVINVSIRSGTNQFPRQGLRLSAQHCIQCHRPFHAAHQPAYRPAAKADPDPQPVRRNLRRPNLEGSHLLLCRLRRYAAGGSRLQLGHRPDGQPARHQLARQGQRRLHLLYRSQQQQRAAPQCHCATRSQARAILMA